MEEKLWRATPYALGVALFLAIMASYSGIDRALWWMAFTIGTALLALAFSYFAGLAKEDAILGYIAKIVSGLFGLVAAASMLFGVLVVAKVLASPFWPSRESSEELPENWRR